MGWVFGVWVGVEAMAWSASGDCGGDGLVKGYEGFGSGALERGDD